MYIHTPTITRMHALSVPFSFDLAHWSVCVCGRGGGSICLLQWVDFTAVAVLFCPPMLCTTNSQLTAEQGVALVDAVAHPEQSQGVVIPLGGEWNDLMLVGLNYGGLYGKVMGQHPEDEDRTYRMVARASKKILVLGFFAKEELKPGQAALQVERVSDFLETSGL